jgi:glycerol-3-phosphate dehydrogenase
LTTPALDRSASIEALGRDRWDLLVVGGGITGVATLLEAANRGLHAALVERDDIASETSSRSSKLVHGGLRYLEQFQFRLVRQALAERRAFIRDAPHLVRNQPFLVPILGSPLQLPYIGAGLALYDVFGAARDGGRTRVLGPRAVLERAPAVRRRGLQGGFLYHDAVMDDARLAIALVRTALARGAIALTRMEALSLDPSTSGPRVVTVRDRETGAVQEVRATSVVLATGASDGLTTAEVASGAGGRAASGVLRSRGTHIVLRRSDIPARQGLTLRVPGRVVFVVPWGECWIAGTTDAPHEGATRRPVPREEDIDYLLDALNGALEVPLERKHVVAAFAGIRPLVLPRAGVSSVQASREHRVDRVSAGVLRVRGGKYTTSRLMAREIVDAAVGRPARLDPKVGHPILGGILDAERPALIARLSAASGLDPDLIDALVARHGSEAEAIISAGQDLDLLRPVLPGNSLLEVEVVWGARQELARGVEDVLARRSRLALERRDHGAPAAERVAALLGRELAWSAERTEREAASYGPAADLEYGLPGAHVVAAAREALAVPA